MKLHNSIFRITLISIMFFALFTSCEEDSGLEDSVSENDMGNTNDTQEENLIIGDWIYSSNESSQDFSHIYRFEGNGTVLIGRYEGFQDPLNTSINPESAYTSAIKFYYQSNWTITNDELNIDGDVWSTPSILLENIETNELRLKYTVQNPEYDGSESFRTFRKTNITPSDYDKIIDLSQVQVNGQALTGIWIVSNAYWTTYSGRVGYELSSGTAIRYFVYNENSETLTDVTDSNTLAINARYSFTNEEFLGQTLDRTLIKTSINPFGDYISETYSIDHFDINTNGNVNFISLNDGYTGLIKWN